ncbi:MAG: MarR family transcriptional regulator [Cyanobacteria bacterium P01_G01_bin.38]
MTTPLSENKEKLPSDLVLACRRLYAAIDKLDQAAASLAGVSRNDLSCLNLLEYGAASPSQIARQLGLTSGSVTMLVDRLERGGLVRRMPDPNDRRGVLVEPLPRLFEILGPVYAKVAQEIERVAQSYDRDEVAAAIQHLDDATFAYKTASVNAQSMKSSCRTME